MKSIVISELDLPTEPPSPLDEKQIVIEPEKSESFVELIEKYDDLYIKNSTAEIIEEDDGENPLQKRRSLNGDKEPFDDGAGKSIIEKLQTIADPEVRREFELELSNAGPTNDDLSENLPPSGTEYEPDYAKKIVNVQEKADNEAENSVQDFKVEDAEKTVGIDYATMAPQQISSRQVNVPEFVEVIEQVFPQPQVIEETKLTTVDPPNIQVDFEPIQILHKGRDHFRNLDMEATTVSNDKFVGYQPSEDLVEAGEENTERDNFFKADDEAIAIKEAEESAVKEAEEIIETLELVGLYGKSLKLENSDKVEASSTVSAEESATTSAPSAASTLESITEIVETRTEISVNIVVNEPVIAPSVVNEIVKESSSSEKSSEESLSSKSKEKKKTFKDNSESSEENSAKEIIDKSELRILDVPSTGNVLMEDLYKSTMNHEVKKKDNPADLLVPSATVERKFDDSDVEAAGKVDEAETTTVGVYETIEDIVTTVSDGIKLSSEFRSSVDSFRDYAEENKTVLDTNSEVISSKNIKNSLVNIAEEMTLENHVNTSEFSYIMVGVFGMISTLVIVSFFITLRRKSRFVLF